MGFLRPYMTNRLTQNQEELECEGIHEEDGVVQTGKGERDINIETPGKTFKAQETPITLPSSLKKKTPTLRRTIVKRDNIIKMRPILLKCMDNREERASERASILENTQPSSDPLYYFFYVNVRINKKNATVVTALGEK